MPGFAFAERSNPVAFWRNNQEKATETASRWNLKSYDSVEALCCADDVDAIFLTSPDALHLQHAEIAFRCGKPVLCEKPMAMNAAECEQIIASASSAEVLIAVAHVMRFEQSVNVAREWVASGELGEVLSARAEFTYPGFDSSRTWITDASLACGGPTGDVGVHCFDVLRYVLQREVTGVQAVMHSGRHSGTVEANASVTLEFGDEALANVFVSTQAPYRTYLEVIGSKFTLESRNSFYVGGGVDVVLVEEGREVRRETCDNSRAYGIQVDAFTGAIEGEKPFACSANDGLINQTIIDAAYKSARTGVKINL